MEPKLENYMIYFPARRFGILATLAAMVAVALAACSDAEPSAEELTFMAGFKPQANLPFVAAYVAQEKGYFEEQNLDVEIQHSNGEHLQLLTTGRVDVTTADAGSVLKRRADPGVPIKAIALFGQKGQQAFAVLEESGIDSPQDWEGKTFGYKISLPPGYTAILEAAGVDREEIEEVRVGFDPRILIEERVDILAVYKSNEPNVLRKLGKSVRVFDPSEFGAPTLGLTYIATEDKIEQQPEALRRFLKATIKGLEFAFDNPSEAVDIVLQYAPEEERDHMRYMLETEMEDAVSPVTRDLGLGRMTLDQWQAFHDFLVDHGALENEIDVGNALDDGLLAAAYDENGRLRWP
ncbi:MAG: ABC transporter substrate-binding protein [Chloroflexota bacterium]